MMPDRTLPATDPLRSAWLILLLSLLLAGCRPEGLSAGSDGLENPWFDTFMHHLADRRETPVYPIPHTVPVNWAAARLGQALFSAPVLSRDGSVSCATCHHLRQGGDDGRPVSTGIDGRTGTLNALSVLNSGFNAFFMWDGRTDRLEDQARFPLLNPQEMGNDSLAAVVRRLNAHPQWRRRFLETFGGEASESRLLFALAEFQRTLITPGSRFDRWLTGDETALTPLERRGWERFQALGCIACHQGFNLGGQLFQKSGLFTDPAPVDPAHEQRWLGRFLLTGRPEDRFVMRVPPLRNVAQTAPYFHDGSVATLSEAIRRMIESQLGLNAAEADIRAIEAFLRATSAPLKEWPS